MKKLLVITLSLIIVFSLCACGSKEMEKINCSSCGESISKDVAFCEHCGAAVNNADNESADNLSANSSPIESQTEETSQPTFSAQDTSKPLTNSKPSSSTTTPNSSKPQSTKPTNDVKNETVHQNSSVNINSSSLQQPNNNSTVPELLKLMCPVAKESYVLTGLYKKGKHNGIDFSAISGTPIYAAESGTITFSGYNSRDGYKIVIDHENGLETSYLHCKELLKEKGVKIQIGEVIATVGTTGKSTGPHLCFEVVKDGVNVDPYEYIKWN